MGKVAGTARGAGGESRLYLWRGWAYDAPEPEEVLTMTDKPRVAYQGIPGAYSHIAACELFPDDAEMVPCESFKEMFEKLEQNEVDFSLLPLANNMAGSVSGAYELLMDHNARIHKEIILRIRHALLAAPGTHFADVKFARSHPQALLQCDNYLEKHGIAAVSWYDTAAAAKDLAAKPETGVAVIASEQAACEYGLQVLATRIEDYKHNYTRFLLLGHGDPKRDEDEASKTSIVFTTMHKPAALHACLGIFATLRINITNIESRPWRSNPRVPLFYLDFEGHREDENCRELLLQLLNEASYIKVLGSYPRSPVDSAGL